MILLDEQEIMLAQMLFGSAAIIECDALPTTDISQTTFYKTPTGLYWYTDRWNKVLNRNDPNDITKPARGSTGNDGFVEAIPGLLKMYNDSSGVRLDGNGNLCIAQARGANGEDVDDLLATTPQKQRSVNRPITPSNLEYALRQFIPLVTYTSSLSGASASNKQAVSVGAVKAFVDSTKTTLQEKINTDIDDALESAKSYADEQKKQIDRKLKVRRKIITRGEAWPIPPNVIGLLFPWDTMQFTTYDTITNILEGGVSFVWTSEEGTRTEGSTTIPVYDLAIISLNDITIESIFDLTDLVQSSHNTYDIQGRRYCKMINPNDSYSGSGYAYFYYIDFN